MRTEEMTVKKLVLVVVVLNIIVGILSGCGDRPNPPENIQKAGKQVDIYVDGNEILITNKPFIEGRRLYLPLDSVLTAMGWTYNHEKDGSLAISYKTLNGSGTTYMHDEWEDTLRLVDGHIYIHSKRLSGLTDSEIVFNAGTGKVMITTSPNPGEVTDEDREELLAWQAKQETVAENTMSAEESEQINYGKYSDLDIFSDLYSLDKELEEEGLSLWDELGFYGGYYQSEYGNTPWDIISFGWTGGDGEHYGFLTEFGSVPDLNNAPIVRVSPMGGDEAGEVIANNIREFLSVIAIDSTFIYMSFESDEAYQNYLQEEEEAQYEWAPTEEDQANRRKVMSRLVDALNLPKIDHPYTYLDRVKAAREKRIVVATPDGLGVTNVHPGDKGQQHETLLVDDDLEAEELQGYLKRATYAGKLALIRTFNAKGFHSEEVEKVMVEEMTRLGLTDEIARMNASAW
ncbi:hypothetical protein MHH56_01390 [Paenibacillus sp. FSL K6-3182]|uniref:hypothetical protein n=1 Tax=Paenibacillus sp. FSL K6-3182 TaxID=2921495 RepID=UPI0030D1F640